MDSKETKGENLSILDEIYNETRNSPRQKIGFRGIIREFFNDEKRLNALLATAVLLFGVSGVVVGFAKVRSNIFVKPDVVENKALKLAAAQAEPDLLGLRQKDSDQDTLSDYDEINLYGTSPYLSDTDSDGITDVKEIQVNSDPTCGKGGNCFRSLNTVLDASAGQDKSQSQSLYIDSQAQLKQLRKALSLSGMSEEELAALNDQDLVLAYQAALAQNSSSGGATTGVTIQGIDDLNKLTPDQIRSILLTAGVSSEVLEKISDQDLLELMKQVTTESGLANSLNATTTQ